MSLLQMSFSGAIMILAIIVIRAMAITKLPKKVFVLLWEVVLLRLLIPFSIPSMLSAYSFVRRNTPIQDALAEIPTDTVIYQVAGGELNMNVTEVLQNDVSNLSIWAIIWIVGVILCALFFAVSYLRCYFEFKTSLPVRNEFATKWLEEHQLKRSIQIRQSDRISAPLTYGILSPVILMPKKTDWENRQQLQYVLLHEYMHICRFDMAMKLIATLALCIHWFNPMVWIMYILFNRDIELACDESVVRQFGETSKSIYARTLITMEEKKSGLTPLCNNFSRNAIEERVTAIMKTKKITIWTLIISVVVLVAIVVLFATSAEKESVSNNVGEGMVVFTDDLRQQLGNMDVADEQTVKIRENTMTIQCMLEGMLEEMPSTLYVGDGFSIYIPDEDWQIYDETLESPVQMTAVRSSEVSIWVEHYIDETFLDVEASLLAEGYTYDTHVVKMQKLDGEILLEARLTVQDKDVWAVFSMYPAAYEWGPRLDAIADTFAVTGKVGESSLEMEQEESVQKSEDAQELENIMTSFYMAYFEGDVDTIKQYLAESFEGNIETDNVDMDELDVNGIKGLDNDVEANIGDECVLSLEFTYPNEDSFTYLTVSFLKENDGWKIESYGLEK